MILIIEDKDDPTGQIVEETEGGTEFVYIPVIMVPAGNDAKQLRTKCTLDRICYKLRKDKAGECPSPQQAGRLLVPLFLKALCHTGRRPEYLSGVAEISVFGTQPENGQTGFCTRG